MDVGLVCDACSALTPIGVPQCARCGQPVALDPRPKRAQRAATERNGDRRLAQPRSTNAGTASAPRAASAASMIPPNFKFCPIVRQQGVGVGSVAQASKTSRSQTRVGPRTADPSAQKPGRSTLFFGGAMQAARAKLTLIRGDGEDGVSFTLAGTDHLAGRGECPISFPDDHVPVADARELSLLEQPARRSRRGLAQRRVRADQRHACRSRAGTTILVGEQVLTVTPAQVAEDVPDTEGTYYSASMIRHATLEIAQQLRGGTPGWVFRVDTETVSIGRESNDINFPDDPFISGRHAQIQLAQGVLSVTDLGSRNGTFVRVTGEHVLKHGDYVFLGQQLLRVEIV